MKKTGVLLMLCLGGLVWAAEPEKEKGKIEPVVMRLEALQLADELASKWKDGSHLPADALDESGVHLLQSTAVAGVTGRESVVFVGRKNPIIYYDSRATQFQVQYVDVGAKVNCSCKQLSDGKLSAQLYTELSLLEKNVPAGGVSYPQTLSFKSQSEVPHLSYGEKVVVGTMEGAQAQQYLQVMGVANRAKNDNIYFVLTVERP